MSFIIVDNTKDLSNAEMTPLIIDFFKKKNIKVFIISENDSLQKIKRDEILGIILSGGPILLSSKTELFRYIKNFTILIEYPEIPILGICFGFQLISIAYGGDIKNLGSKLKDRVYEQINIFNANNSILFKNINKNPIVFQCHQDYINRAPTGFLITSKTSDGIIQSIENTKRFRFGVQFHPENSPDCGNTILENFVDFCYKIQGRN